MQQEERVPTYEQCVEYDLRELSSARKKHVFKYTTNTGSTQYRLIEIGSVYSITNPSFKKSNKIVRIISFIYRKQDTYNIEDKSLPYPENIDPIGVEIQFLQDNKKGTYYNLEHLELVK